MIRKVFAGSRLARYLPVLLGSLVLSQVAAASTLTVTGASAHCGNFGLAVQMDGSNAAWVETDHPANDAHYVVRFYVKLDAATPASELQVFSAFKGTDGVDLSTPVLVALIDASKNLKVQYRTNAGLQSPVATHAMGTGWHAVEMDWQAAAGTGALTTKIDNTTDATLSFSGLTNDTATVDFARWGAVGGTLTGTGYLMLDDFVSQRTGPIGLTAGCTPNENQTPAPFAFYTITPCRVYDSRNAGGGGSPVPITNNEARTIVLGGACGVPADARSVSLNLTTTAAGGDGQIVLYPDTVATPNTLSIAFHQNRDLADQVIMTVGPAHAVVAKATMVVPSVQTHFIIDVNGYFK